MSSEISPPSEQMDISENSNSSQECDINSSQVLRLSNPETKQFLDNDLTARHKSLTQNATNSHPLMYYSPTSPISPDFPDLIPEKPKNKNIYNVETSIFNPEAHSSYNEFIGGTQILDNSIRKRLNLDLPSLEDYNDELPDFPASPSIMKKSLMYGSQEVDYHDASDTENDKSVYEAHLSSNLQSVALTMNEKEGNLNFLAHGNKSTKLRRVKVLHIETSQDSDISSLESISESLKSEDVYARGVDDKEEINNGESDSQTEPIEPLSAEEERKHARHWQRMVLPEGEERTIDMRVIEPYKRVLSHGGYLKAGGHTAIVVFSACYLPDRSRVDYVYVMDNLFLYVLWTLERLITDDYVLVYLHGGATRLPSFGWLKQCYNMVGRKLRKNLNQLYLVHPTLWIKTMLFMAKPFISSKFYRKISYVTNLRDLYNRVPLEPNAVPSKVKAYDNFHYGS